MASGLTIKLADPADIPTPDTDKQTIFIDSTAVPGPVASYKDDAGSVFPLGTTGPQGPHGSGILPEDVIHEDWWPPAIGSSSGVNLSQTVINAPSNSGSAGTFLGQPPSILPIVPRPTYRRFGYAIASGSVMTTGQGLACTIASPGALAAKVTDSSGQSLRVTATNSIGASASVKGSLATAGQPVDIWFNHDPYGQIIIKTGPGAADIANTRIYVGFFSSIPTNSDALAALKGIGVRFSTVATDPGFVLWTADGTTQQIGSVNLGNIANTIVYRIGFGVNPDNMQGYVTVSQGNDLTNAITDSVTVGSGALSTSMDMYAIIFNTNGTGFRVFNVNSAYFEAF